jgi:NarL family two-component system response regulator LiaR
MNPPIRVLLADDHEIVREGLRTLFSDEPDIEVVGEAKNGREAVELAATLAPDVILMDLVMPEMDGIEATRWIRSASPASRVVVLSTFVASDQVTQVIRAGATGYLLKDALKGDLLGAIRNAVQDVPTLHPEAQRHLMQQVRTPQEPSPLLELTAREREVLALLATGRSNKQIAAALQLREATVKGYVSAILLKLDVEDRTQAALLAARQPNP